MIGIISNDINLSLGPETQPSKYLNNDDRAELAKHGIVKRSRKPGKAAEIRDHDQAVLQHEQLWRNEPVLYNCGSTHDCLGHIVTPMGYTLLCDHCNPEDEG